MGASLRASFMKSKLLHFCIGSAIVWILPASFNPLSFLAAFIPSVFAPSLLIPCITAGTGILIYSAIPDKFKKPAHVLRFLAFLSLAPFCIFLDCCHKALQKQSKGTRSRVIVFTLIALYIIAAVLNPVPMPPLVSHLFFFSFFTGLFYLGCFFLIAVNTIQHKNNPSSPSYILGCLFNPTQPKTVQKQNSDDAIETSKLESIKQALQSLIPDALQKFSATLVDSILGIYRATATLSNALLGSSLVRSLDKMASPPDTEGKEAFMEHSVPPAAPQYSQKTDGFTTDLTHHSTTP